MHLFWLLEFDKAVGEQCHSLLVCLLRCWAAKLVDAQFSDQRVVHIVSQNLTWELQNLCAPWCWSGNLGAAPKLSWTALGDLGTLPWTFRNLPWELRQSTPELILAEDPISARCWENNFRSRTFKLLKIARGTAPRKKQRQSVQLSLNAVAHPQHILICQLPHCLEPGFTSVCEHSDSHTRARYATKPEPRTQRKETLNFLTWARLHRHFDIESDSAGGTPHARDLKKHACARPWWQMTTRNRESLSQTSTLAAKESLEVLITLTSCLSGRDPERNGSFSRNLTIPTGTLEARSSRTSTYLPWKTCEPQFLTSLWWPAVHFTAKSWLFCLLPRIPPCTPVNYHVSDTLSMVGHKLVPRHMGQHVDHEMHCRHVDHGPWAPGLTVQPWGGQAPVDIELPSVCRSHGLRHC